MNTIIEIRKIAEEKRTDLFNKTGLFFAFSEKQFQESKTTLKEGEKYVSIGGGGYLPKSNLELFVNGMREIKAWELKYSAKVTREHILYELNNYECFYVGSIEEALKVLPYSRKKVEKVYFEERRKWEEKNDCFAIN